MVESTRITSKTTTNNISFYISSLQTNIPQKYHDLARGHWSIENQLHIHQT